MRQFRRGLFRLWVIATVAFEIWIARDLIEFVWTYHPTGWGENGLIWGLAMVLPPLAVLAFGRALLWAIAGFRGE